MNDGILYKIYRVYDPDNPNDRAAKTIMSANRRLVAYSFNIKLVKAFLKQRDKKKYIVSRELIDNDTGISFGEFDNGELELDILKLKSHDNDEEFELVSTLEEQHRIETGVRRIFNELCSFANMWPTYPSEGFKISTFVNAINNLRPGYQNALNFIGYRPEELRSVFDDITDDDMFGTDSMLDNNRWYTNDPCRIMIYSLESAIMVIKDDM